ncbi:MAG: hypothetical protein ACK58J_20465 [Planctomyces sp.]
MSVMSCEYEQKSAGSGQRVWFFVHFSAGIDRILRAVAWLGRSAKCWWQRSLSWFWGVRGLV